MKYGIITYDKRPMELDGRDIKNIGDMIQTFAAKELLSNITKDEIVEISYYDLPYYNGKEYVVLLCNGYNSFLREVHTKTCLDLPYSEKIIPVFISFHCHTEPPKEAIEYFKKFEPIGCRDEETMKILRKKGIEAYLSGCITALLDKRESTPEKGKVYLIDTPEKLDEYIPDELKEKTEKMTQNFPLPRTDGSSIMTEEEYHTIYEYSCNRIKQLRENAILVVTSRLHIAVPCMAMGIPVICAGNNFDRRFSWLDKYLKFYTPDEFGNIDWKIKPIDYEEGKAFVKSSILKQMEKVYKEKRNVYELSEFYENRERFEYNSTLRKKLESIPINKEEKTRYVIWGAVTLAVELKSVIDKYCPKWEMIHVIDLKCEGQFEGMDIERPEIIDTLDDDTIFIVVPDSAHKPVAKLLQEKRKKYILLNYNVCRWSDNINE